MSGELDDGERINEDEQPEEALFDDDVEDNNNEEEDADYGVNEDEDNDYEPQQAFDEQPAEALEDDVPAPAPANIEQPAPAAASLDRRAILAQLVAKKRQQDEGDDGGKKKRRKKDKDDDDKKDKKRKRDKEGKKSKKDKEDRPRRSARQSGGDEQPRREREGPRPDREGSVDSRELNEEDADRAFIDDDGVAVEQRYLEDGGGVRGEEAEEVDEAAAEAEELSEADDDTNLFGRKKEKRKKEENEAQMQAVVTDVLAKMEAAAECDADANGAGKPAVEKLKLLNEVSVFLAKRKYHELFIQLGGLGVLKAWLEPYKDGSLPNICVRKAILRACVELPIDTAREDIKSNLKTSQLGSRIMFLMKCPEESMDNKRVARELVQKWSRPIFYDAEVEAEKRRVKEEQLRKARIQSVEAQRVADEKLAEMKRNAPKQPGKAGYRWHAMIPQASKLDYVVQPERDERVAAAAAAAQAKAATSDKDSRLNKKLRELQRKNKAAGSRAAKPSVEGRGMIIMH